MDEVLQSIQQRIEQHNFEEQRLAKNLRPIAINFPYSMIEVRATYDLLRRRFSESESIAKTRQICELAVGSGLAPSTLVPS